jgi:acyl-CoA thioesterase-1
MRLKFQAGLTLFVVLSLVTLGNGKTLAGEPSSPTAARAKDATAQRPTAKSPRRQSPFAEVKDDPKLPRVLLIGDSISIGYTIPLRKLLAGQANVHRIPTNGGPTTRGLQQIDQWLGDGKWDVIHFNWGLHDLKHADPKGQLVAADKDKQQVPIDQYEQNLRQLVKRLKKTGAKLVWCSTTPVPEGAAGRVVGDAARYNVVAQRVMKQVGIPIDDLYTLCKPRLQEIQRPANVHFTPDGSQVLAEQAAKMILKAIETK